MEILVRELASFSFYEGFSWSQSFFNDVVYTLIINWPDLHRSLEKVFSTISIAIFCDDDVAYSHYLKELLVFKFGESIRIDLVAPSVKPCELDEWGDYDILLSNMSNVRITKGTFICLPAAPSTRDWQIIQHEISRLSRLKGGLSTKLMRF